MVENNKNLSWNLIFLSWLIASISTGGSLFFSEVMMFMPCVLCWYQRICMYPLAILYIFGLIPLDLKVVKFTFPLIVTGWIIALYHNLLHYEIIPESAAPCAQGVPCSTVYIDWFGFLTIPMLSFLSFTILLVLSIILYRKSNQ